VTVAWLPVVLSHKRASHGRISCVAVCCSVLQCCHVLPALICVGVCYSVVQSGAVCCGVLQRAAECLTCCAVDIELRAIVGFHVLQCAAT